jgi:hypothetical protein
VFCRPRRCTLLGFSNEIIVMAKEIIKGYAVKCDCCANPLVAEFTFGDGKEKVEIPAHYPIFLKKEDAEKVAMKHGLEIMEIQMAL